MLIDQHSYTDAGHVESVQEVLDLVLYVVLNAVGAFHFQDALAEHRRKK